MRYRIVERDRVQQRQSYPFAVVDTEQGNRVVNEYSDWVLATCIAQALNEEHERTQKYRSYDHGVYQGVVIAKSAACRIWERYKDDATDGQKTLINDVIGEINDAQGEAGINIPRRND